MQTSSSSVLNSLLSAVIDGDLSFLISNLTPKNVNYCDPRYRLPLLQWAISLGRLPTTQLLLSRGASLLIVDGNGFTPLHRAVWCADVAVVTMILFASPAARTRETTAPHSSTVAPLNAAANGGMGVRGGDTGGGHAFTQWLGSHTSERSKSKSKKHELSWRPGAQQLVNVPHTATGRTPLMLAAVRGSAVLVSLLLDCCHADMHLKDKDGYTAAELAALCGHTDILNLFLAKAEGDGSGRAFQHIQQHAEDYVLTAKTVKQQQRLNEVNRRVCEDLALQSVILPI